MTLQPIETTEIETLSHDGRGLARINGKATFIEGALPDETVTFRYTRRKGDYDEGQVSQVLKAASTRAEPACAHYQVCGGCSLQHLSAAAQIPMKQSLLLNSLARIGHTEPESVFDAITGPSLQYRSKARLSVRYVIKKQSSLVGFREKNNPRYIAEIEECPVLHAKVGQKIMALRALIDTLDACHAIAQIELAAGDDEVALIFRNLSALGAEDLARLESFGKAEAFAIFLQPEGVDSIHLLYSPTGSEWLHYSLPEEGLNFAFHPSDFTQVNMAVNRKMVQKALALLALSPNDVVLDLFCGLGNFSLPLAKHCQKVIGIEGSEAMVQRASSNAEANQIRNAAFYCADLSKPLDALLPMLKGVSKILLDPPRTGAFDLVKNIELFNPSSIVYVSCNPATLARDADVLVNTKGYRLRTAGILDMFPHTAHVESIALFEKR